MNFEHFDDAALKSHASALENELKEIRNEQLKRLYDARPLPRHPISRIKNTHGGVPISRVIPSGSILYTKNRI